MYRRKQWRDLMLAALWCCGLCALPGLGLMIGAVGNWVFAGPFPDPFYAELDAVLIAKVFVGGLACGLLPLGLGFPFLFAFRPMGGRAGEVFVSWKGACVGDLWHHSWGDGVEKVKCVRGDPSTATIQCIFLGGAGRGRNLRRTFVIPVPRGKEGEVRKLARDLITC
jgi:hypothetical protein